jgi:HEPN domain-containing protein
LECLLYLDKQYIPTRYPDAFAEGAPMDYYTDRDAEACIKCAEAVLG